MDDAPFGLNECQRVFFTAGVRYILRSPSENVSREIFRQASPEDLPEAFQKLLQNTEPGSTTLWTYAELAPDLMGSGSPERSRFLKTLIQSLAWPKGSICFWPFTTWENQELQQRPDIFFLGLQRLSPQSVVVFGREIFEMTLSLHDGLKNFVMEQTIPCVWLQELSMLLECGTPDADTIDILQRLKKSLS